MFSSLLYSQLWQGTSVTSAQLTQLAGLYDLFVKGCGGVAANCFLNTQGCGNYGARFARAAQETPPGPPAPGLGLVASWP